MIVISYDGSIKKKNRQRTLRWLLKNKNNKFKQIISKDFSVRCMLSPLEDHIQWMREIIPNK